MEKKSWCVVVSGAWSGALTLDEEKGESVSREGAQLLREVSLEGTQLTERQQADLAAVLEALAQAFSLHEANYELTSTLMYKIPTGDSWPVPQRHWPIPPALYQEVKDILRQRQEN